MQLSDILSLLQTASVVLAILVAFGTVKGRSDTKVIDMTVIKTNLEYIKKAVECIPGQTLQINNIQKDVEALTKRFEDHLAVHNRKEEDQ